MNQSLTLAFLIAAGIGLVVQNTLMVRITQTSSTILIAMLLMQWYCALCFYLCVKEGMAGFGELVSSVRGGHLYLACWNRFLSSPVSADIRMWERRQLLQYGRQPADWRSGSGYLPQSLAYHYGRCSAQFVAQFYLWLAPGW